MHTQHTLNTQVSLGYDSNDDLHGTLSHLLTYYTLMATKVGFNNELPAYGATSTDHLSIDTFTIHEDECGKVMVSMVGTYRSNTPITLLFSFEGDFVVVDCNIKSGLVTIQDMIETVRYFFDANPFKPSMLDFIASL